MGKTGKGKGKARTNGAKGDGEFIYSARMPRRAKVTWKEIEERWDRLGLTTDLKHIARREYERKMEATGREPIQLIKPNLPKPKNKEKEEGFPTPNLLQSRRLFRVANRYYWAYGSNLNVRQMLRRCPDAERIKPLPVYGVKLVFRGVADVVLTGNREDVCPGGLWRISTRDEITLDRYEGIASGMYEKRTFPLTTRTGNVVEIMYYKMRSTGIMPPSDRYFETIVHGYEDFGLDLDYLDRVLRASWDDKDKTNDMLERRKKDGTPRAQTAADEPAPETMKEGEDQ